MKAEFKRYLFRISLIIAIGIIVVAGYHFFPLNDSFNESVNREFINGFGLFAPLVYGVIYFFATILMLPSSVFSILAGVLFGKILGTAVVVISATMAAGTGFLIARYTGKDFVDKIARGKNVSNLIRILEWNISNHGFRTFFILRSLWLPYMLVTYSAGLIKTAQLKEFVLATFLTNIVFSSALVYMGESFFRGPQALMLPFILIIITIQLPRVIRAFCNRFGKGLKISVPN